MLRCTVGPPKVKRVSGSYGLTSSYFEYDLRFRKTHQPPAEASLPAGEIPAEEEEWVVSKRYSQFVRLYEDLKMFHPNLRLPALPPKVLWFMQCNVDHVMESRRKGLQKAIDACINAVELQGCAVLLDFIKAPNRSVLLWRRKERLRDDAPEKEEIQEIEGKKAAQLLDEICQLENELDEEMQQEFVTNAPTGKARDVPFFGFVSSELNLFVKLMVAAIAVALICLIPSSTQVVLTKKPQVEGGIVVDTLQNLTAQKEEIEQNLSAHLVGALRSNETSIEDEHIVASTCISSVNNLTWLSQGPAKSQFAVEFLEEEEIHGENNSSGKKSEQDKGSLGWDAPLLLTVVGCISWYIVEYLTIPDRREDEKSFEDSRNSTEPTDVEADQPTEAEIDVSQSVEAEEARIEEQQPGAPSPEIEAEDITLQAEAFSGAEPQEEAKSETTNAEDKGVAGVELSMSEEQVSAAEEINAKEERNSQELLLQKRKVTARAIVVLILSLMAIRSKKVLKILAALGKARTRV